jgi:histidinol dehydrogenase
MKSYRYEDLSRAQLTDLCERNPLWDETIIETCREIFSAVEERGDEALREFTRRFDGAELSDFRVDSRGFQQACQAIPGATMEALQRAAANIRTFHSSQKLSEEPVEVEDGVTCWRAARAIRSVGLYVPGGTAVLPSTVLMLAIPAKLAGCNRTVLCVPPRSDGTVHPLVLAAAQIAGLRQVFRVGGAQAIAAMSIGTESIPKVDKILGPGNRYVQGAKMLATFRGTAIDMVAGPSEVLVIADDTASARVVAADLISQAEHGPDSQAVLVTNSPELLAKVEGELERQLSDLPRDEHARTALETSFAVLVPDFEKGFEFSNLYAPEHLILNLSSPREWLGHVKNAGSVFVGPWTPEVAGDYASGTNHTLPTSGQARSVSGVSMESFVKKITFQEISVAGLRSLAPTLEILAGEEALEGHVRAVRYRLDSEES